jgi:hypothetical protein
MARRKWSVRKTVMGNDRASSMYLTERAEPVGRSLSAGYRFAKIARSNAATFRSETEAKKVMQSMRKRDSDGNYSIIAL